MRWTATPMEMRMVAVSIDLVTMGTLLYAAISSFSGMVVATEGSQVCVNGWLVG